MAKNKRKRPQRQKPHKHANPEMAAAMREIRRSNATVPVPSGTTYNRASFRAQAQRGRWDD